MLSYLNAARFMLSKTPSHFIFFVTARCNFRCRHCFYWNKVTKANSHSEFTLDEIEKLSGSLPHIKLVSLTGGEPFIRNDLAEIAEIFYRNNGVHHLVVHTNGSFGERVQSFAEQIMTNCPDISLSISLSLDGHEDTHDFIRGENGSYDLVQRTIDLLQPLRKKFSRFEVEVTSVVSKYNHNEMSAVINTLSDDERIDSHAVEIVRGNTHDPKARLTDPNEFISSVRHHQSVQPKLKKKTDYPLSSFRQVIDELTPEIELETIIKKKIIFPCTAGKRLMVLTEEGELLPCELLGRSFGNVRDNAYNLKKMLTSKKAKNIKNHIRKSGCFCTWGCAISNNLIFNASAWPKVFKKWVKNTQKAHS